MNSLVHRELGISTQISQRQDELGLSAYTETALTQVNYKSNGITKSWKLSSFVPDVFFSSPHDMQRQGINARW